MTPSQQAVSEVGQVPSAAQERVGARTATHTAPQEAHSVTVRASVEALRSANAREENNHERGYDHRCPGGCRRSAPGSAWRDLGRHLGWCDALGYGLSRSLARRDRGSRRYWPGPGDVQGPRLGLAEAPHRRRRALAGRRRNRGLDHHAAVGGNDSSEAAQTATPTRAVETPEAGQTE